MPSAFPPGTGPSFFLPGHHSGTRSQSGSLKSFFFVDFVIYLHTENISIYTSRTCIDMYAYAYIAKPVNRLFIYNTSIMSLYYTISIYI